MSIFSLSKDENECHRNSDKCSYCIPMGECFHRNNLIYVDHCKILEREGNQFSLDLVVLNQAMINITGTYQV